MYFYQIIFSCTVSNVFLIFRFLVTIDKNVKFFYCLHLANSHGYAFNPSLHKESHSLAYFLSLKITYIYILLSGYICYMFLIIVT